MLRDKLVRRAEGLYDSCRSGYETFARPFKADKARHARMRAREEALEESPDYVGDEKRVRERYTKGIRIGAGFPHGFQKVFIDDDTAFDSSKLLGDPDDIDDDEWDRLLE